MFKIYTYGIDYLPRKDEIFLSGCLRKECAVLKIHMRSIDYVPWKRGSDCHSVFIMPWLLSQACSRAGKSALNYFSSRRVCPDRGHAEASRLRGLCCLHMPFLARICPNPCQRGSGNDELPDEPRNRPFWYNNVFRKAMALHIFTAEVIGSVRRKQRCPLSSFNRQQTMYNGVPALLHLICV